MIKALHDTQLLLHWYLLLSREASLMAVACKRQHASRGLADGKHTAAGRLATKPS